MASALTALGMRDLLWGDSTVGILFLCESFLILSAAVGAHYAYNRGWLAGRSTMISALVEAQRRDLGLDDWLRGEFERDAIGMAKLLRDKGRANER